VQLTADAEFQKLNPRQQAEAVIFSTAAGSVVQSASKPGTALLRVNRYRNEEVPRQLQRLSSLASPPGSTEQKLITVVPASALRAAARQELAQGHRISL
jgi:hypothetical protein